MLPYPQRFCHAQRESKLSKFVVFEGCKIQLIGVPCTSFKEHRVGPLKSSARQVYSGVPGGSAPQVALILPSTVAAVGTWPAESETPGYQGVMQGCDRADLRIKEAYGGGPFPVLTGAGGLTIESYKWETPFCFLPGGGLPWTPRSGGRAGNPLYRNCLFPLVRGPLFRHCFVFSFFEGLQAPGGFSSLLSRNFT